MLDMLNMEISISQYLYIILYLILFASTFQAIESFVKLYNHFKENKEEEKNGCNSEEYY